MIQRHANRFFLGLAIVVGMSVTILIAVGQMPAQIQTSTDNETVAESTGEQKGSVKIGTYNPEKAFQAHPAQKKLMEALRSAQTDMQKAQQENDQKKIQEVQAEYGQARTRILEGYEKDLKKALPKAAKAKGVEAVALEIVYKKQGVKTADVTPLLVKEFAEDKDNDDEERKMPQFPRQ